MIFWGWLFMVIVVCSSRAHAAGLRNYKLCQGVRTATFSDPLYQRTLIVNYNPQTKKYVFLRCGASDRERLSEPTQKLPCHIYRAGDEQKLCRNELQDNRAASIVGNTIDMGLRTLIFSGQISALNAAGVARKSAKDQKKLGQACLGLSLMKGMATAQEVSPLRENFYQQQVELAPASVLVKQTTKNAKAKDSFIFDQLNALLARGAQNSSETPALYRKGPALVSVARSGSGVDSLDFDEDQQKTLCQEILSQTSTRVYQSAKDPKPSSPTPTEN